MQTGKIRRTVAKLQQLRDDFYAFPAQNFTLWYVQRTESSLRKKPPGLRLAYPLYTINTPTCEYYVTADAASFLPPMPQSGLLDPNVSQLLDQKLSELTQVFCSLIHRTDSLLKQINLVPNHTDAVFFAVVNLALNEKTDTVFPYYWQGGTKFAKSWVDIMQVPLACLDWFVVVPLLPEAVADTIDELLTNLEAVSDGQQQMPVTIEQHAAKPSEPVTIEQPAAEPSEPKQDASDKTVAFSFLLLWHRYGTKDFYSEPIPSEAKFVPWMQKNAAGKPVPSYATVWRLLKDMFGNKTKYNQACRAGTLEPMLKIANREGAPVFQGSRPLKERSIEAPDMDLD